MMKLQDFIARYPKIAELTHFQQKVLFCTAQIPSGKVVSYEQIAIQAGKPRACRAVGNALNKNPYIGQIPCHRVIRKNGQLGGFGADISLKRHLLEMEGITLESL